MSYDLQFLPSALKEWQKLGSTIREQFRKKLAERLTTPHVPGDALHGLHHHYKIKLRTSGYRLVYRVEDQSVTVTVVAVGKRERSSVYRAATARATSDEVTRGRPGVLGHGSGPRDDQSRSTNGPPEALS